MQLSVAHGPEELMADCQWQLRNWAQDCSYSDTALFCCFTFTGGQEM